LPCSAEAVPTDVEAVRVVAMFKQRAHLVEQLECRDDFVRAEVEDGLLVSLRNDYTGAGQRFAVFKVSKDGEVILSKDDAIAPQSVEIAERAVVHSR